MTATAPRLGSALPPANLPEAPVDELLTRFETDDREAVRSFLLTDPVLLFPLAASVPQIESVFGENVRIVLEPVVDPETADRPVLCALIQVQGGTVSEALERLERLERFQRHWWYTARPRRSETLLFDVEVR